MTMYTNYHIFFEHNDYSLCGVWFRQVNVCGFVFDDAEDFVDTVGSNAAVWSYEEFCGECSLLVLNRLSEG